MAGLIHTDSREETAAVLTLAAMAIGGLVGLGAIMWTIS